MSMTFLEDCVEHMVKFPTPKVVNFPQTDVILQLRKRCEYEVLISSSAAGNTVRQCRHKATIKVNNGGYCTRHAGNLLVKLLMESGGEGSKGEI